MAFCSEHKSSLSVVKIQRGIPRILSGLYSYNDLQTDATEATYLGTHVGQVHVPLGRNPHTRSLRQAFRNYSDDWMASLSSLPHGP